MKCFIKGFLLHCFCTILIASPLSPFTNIEFNVMIENYWTMRLAARNGVWEPVCRSRPSFNLVDFGYVTSSEGTAEKFKINIQLEKDDFIPSGSPDYIFYTMQFEKISQEEYKGIFICESNGSITTGKLSAIVMPPQKSWGITEIKPEEHPRLLFRKNQLDKLKQKLQTEFGKAFLEKAKESKDPVVLGLLYQLTSNTMYAIEAMKIIASYTDIDANGGLTGDIGHQIVRTVLTYDLCYEGWPENFKKQLKEDIKARLPKRQYNLIIGHANYNEVSNYYGPGFGSAAIATLVLYKDKGAPPLPVPPPLCVLYEDCKIPPAENYNPPEGVPVIPLIEGELPSEWIYCGGFKPAPGNELLNQIGGPKKARPTLEDTLTDEIKTEKFRPLSHELDKGFYEWGGHKVVDVTSAIGRIYHSESYFYTVLKNDKPQWLIYMIGKDHKKSFSYLNGILINEGDVVFLDKGLYPLLIKVQIGQTEPWGREMLAVRFEKVDTEKMDIKEINKTLRARYKQACEFWHTQTNEWKSRNEEDLECLKMFYKGHQQMFWHYRHGIGDGGFQAEVSHYGNIAARYPLLYAVYFRNVKGYDVSPYPDATHVLVRQMMQTFFSSSGPIILNLNVKGHFSADWCADYFPIVPEEYKPFILWGWEKLFNIDRSDGSDITYESALKIFNSISSRTIASTFVNHPLDKPLHPSKGMNLVWCAPTLGYYVFRSGWECKDEFIFQVFAKNIPIKAWNHPNAGAFRIWGLGRSWTAAPIERSGYRPEESIVLLPDDVINESSCAHVIHYKSFHDGSGIITLDMNDVYVSADEPPQTPEKEKIAEDIESFIKETKTGETDFGIGKSIKEMPMTQSVVDYYREKEYAELRRKSIPKLYDSYGRRIPIQTNKRIQGSRSFAVDYSKASGSPCLIAIADSIKGGKKKQWLWHVPESSEIKIETQKNSFYIKYPDVYLKGTFISPSNIIVEYNADAKMSFIYKGGSKKGMLVTRSYRIITAESLSSNVDFVVIITIQKDNAPEIKHEYSNNQIYAICGNRKITYDTITRIFSLQ